MMKPKITFESWVAMDDGRLLAEKERSRMSMPWRIWELALAKLNNYGHAPFCKDELVKLACGAVNRANVQAVKRGMKTLADMGRIAPVGDGGSTVLCIRVNADITQRAVGKGGYKYVCSEPSHMGDLKVTAYDPGGIIPPPGGTDGVSATHDEHAVVAPPEAGTSQNACRPWD
jgi:hypothetical protein